MAEPKMTNDLEPHVAQLNIGELLASKRHQRNESVADVASKVRLSPDAVEKLEANRFESIGTAVYVRGYLGIYAKHLGLDAAYIIDQYNRQFPAEAVAIRPSVGQAMGKGRQHSKRHSKTLSFLVAGLVTGSLVYGYARVEPMLLEQGLGQLGAKTIQQAKVTPVPNAEVPTLTTVIDGVDAANSLANDALNGVPIAGAGSLITDIELDLAASPAVSAAEQAQDNAASTPSTPAEIQLESAPVTDNTESETTAENTDDKAVENAEAEPEKPAAPVNVAMTFKAECWVKITDATDKVLTSRVYKAKAKLKVKGTPPLSVVLGNPDAVKSATMNGDAMKLASYKVGRITYSVAPNAANNQ